MTNADHERAIQLLEYYGEKLGCNAEFNLAIKALKVVDKIKKAYSANREIEEIDDAMCFANATYNILCEAYGSDIDCESWKMRLNKEANPNV